MDWLEELVQDIYNAHPADLPIKIKWVNRTRQGRTVWRYSEDTERMLIAGWKLTGTRQYGLLGFRRADNNYYSSGETLAYYSHYSVIIRRGTNDDDCLTVALHELAHCLTAHHHHDDVFYHKCIALFEKYLPADVLKAALKREASYKKNSIKVAAMRGH